MKKSRRLFVVSLGCPKNLVDTEAMLGSLMPQGWEIEAEPEGVDIILINTCSFILPAREESIDTIEQCLELKNSGQVGAVVVTGCFPQSHRSILEKDYPGIDAICDIAEEKKIAEILDRLIPPGKRTKRKKEESEGRLLLTPPHTAYLRIAEGCGRQCAFCTIPAIRGPFRSRPQKEILEEAEALAAAGVRELNLIAQDTTGYGKDLKGAFSLARLIEEIQSISEIDWIRIHYAYPTEITGELLDVVRQQRKVCPYLDLPLQHASGKILRAMRRPGDAGRLEELIERIRSKVANISLRTSFIVGYPGETEEDFECLVSFCQKVRFDHAACFSFSPEQGTAAINLPDRVPGEVKEERLERLTQLLDEIGQEKAHELVGTSREILIDGPSAVFPDFWKGRHSGQAPDIDGVVYVPLEVCEPGDLLPFRLTASEGYDLFAEPVG